MRGETHKDPQGRKAKKVFNPLAPCGARPSLPCLNRRLIIFQSTRPLRGETMLVLLRSIAATFSIHSPLAGRDKTMKTIFDKITLFNPLAPCGARPPSSATSSNPCSFQSTRPLRGETQREGHGQHRHVFFNPLAPCGARHFSLIGHVRHQHFQSTRPLRGETRRHGRNRATRTVFNPLAPCGARPKRL